MIHHCHRLRTLRLTGKWLLLFAKRLQQQPLQLQLHWPSLMKHRCGSNDFRRQLPIVWMPLSLPSPLSVPLSSNCHLLLLLLRPVNNNNDNTKGNKTLSTRSSNSSSTHTIINKYTSTDTLSDGWWKECVERPRRTRRRKNGQKLSLSSSHRQRKRVKRRRRTATCNHVSENGKQKKNRGDGSGTGSKPRTRSKQINTPAPPSFHSLYSCRSPSCHFTRVCTCHFQFSFLHLPPLQSALD